MGERRKEFTEAFQDGSKLTTKHEYLPDGSVVLTKTWSPPKIKPDKKSPGKNALGNNKVVPLDFSGLASSDSDGDMLKAMSMSKASSNQLPPLEEKDVKYKKKDKKKKKRKRDKHRHKDSDRDSEMASESDNQTVTERESEREKDRDRDRDRKEERKERRRSKDKGDHRRSRLSSRASSSDTEFEADTNYGTLNIDDLSDDSQGTFDEIKVRDRRSKKKDKHGRHKGRHSSRGSSRYSDKDGEDRRRDKDEKASTGNIPALSFLGAGINNMSQLVSVLEDMEFVDENPMYGGGVAGVGGNEDAARVRDIAMGIGMTPTTTPPQSANGRIIQSGGAGRSTASAMSSIGPGYSRASTSISRMNDGYGGNYMMDIESDADQMNRVNSNNNTNNISRFNGQDMDADDITNDGSLETVIVAEGPGARSAMIGSQAMRRNNNNNTTRGGRGRSAGPGGMEYYEDDEETNHPLFF